MFLLLTLITAAAASAPATRAELAAQRAAIEQRFDREKAECEQRFIVTPCLEAVRQQRQSALAPLISREHELAAEERRARAAAQVERVRERELAASQEAGQRQQRAQAALPLQPATPASHAVRARSAEEAERQQHLAETQAEAEAARRRAQAQERRDRMQERLAEHAAREKRRLKPAAPPLPLPGASAASAARR